MRITHYYIERINALRYEFSCTFEDHTVLEFGISNEEYDYKSIRQGLIEALRRHYDIDENSLRIIDAIVKATEGCIANV